MKLLWIHVGGRSRAKHPDWKRWTQELKEGLQDLGVAKPRASLSEFQTATLDETEALGTGPEALQAVAELAQGQPVSGVSVLLRDPHTVSVESALMGRTALRITSWTRNPELRRRVRAELKKSLTKWAAAPGMAGEPKVLLAHGVGSLIAYDTLLHHPSLGQGLVLITLGSHLGHPAVRNVYGGRLQTLAVSHWYNLYNPYDLVFTSVLSLVGPRFTEVRTPFAHADGALNHAPVILGRETDAYLDHPVVRELVWPAIVRMESAKPVRGKRKPAAAGEAAPSKDKVEAARGVFQPTHRALLIGIDNYLHPAIPSLKGCVNDTYLISSVLQECGMTADQIRLLHNERATGAAIRERLHWLLDGAAEGDTRVLLFSGHGTQLESYSTGEIVDRQDECLVPWDYQFSRESGIVDDDLWRLYSQLPYGARFISILDCCHAGGTHRGAQRVRGIEPPGDVRHRGIQWNRRLQAWEDRPLDAIAHTMLAQPPPRRAMPPERQAAYFGGSGTVRKLLRASVLRQTDDEAYNKLRKELNHSGPYLPVLFQACGEAELAAEYEHGPVSYGAFTYCLAQAFRAQGPKASYEQLFLDARARLKRLGMNQTPVMLGPDGILTAGMPLSTGSLAPLDSPKVGATEAGWTSSGISTISASSFAPIPSPAGNAASLPLDLIETTARQLLAGLPSKVPTPGNEGSTRKLFGQFRRHFVVKPELFPWNTIVQLIISFPGHPPEGGTGFYVSPRLIVTAGHCLHKWDAGTRTSTRASSITIVPAYGNTGQPPPGFAASDFKAHASWTGSGDISHDFGLILVPEGVQTPRDWLGPKVLPDQGLTGLPCYVAGYAQDVNGLSAAFGSLNQATESLLPHIIDTVPGESGGPIFTEEHGGCFVGIHTAGTDTVNWGVRMRSAVNAQMIQWSLDWQVPLD